MSKEFCSWLRILLDCLFTLFSTFAWWGTRPQNEVEKVDDDNEFFFGLLVFYKTFTEESVACSFKLSYLGEFYYTK